MTQKKKVVVGMSGGVDSSVAALLLKEEDYDLTGIFMKNWEEEDEDGVCTATEDYEDVKKVCFELNIPYYTVNFEEEYQQRVFQDFLEGYKKGLTPNPDVLCNKEIKFKAFLNYALKLDAEYIATGHYARIKYYDGEYHLLRGKDQNKDQSYFLCALNQKQLSRAIFPLGDMKKDKVRELAANNNLPTAEKDDSTGICFIGERDFQEFLSNYLKDKEGEIKTLDGKVVGEHQGIMYYTIGQRRGLGIDSGQGDGSGRPWYVVKKDPTNNTLYVVQGSDNPALYSKGLIATDVNWISEKMNFTKLECTAKIRYRQSVQKAEVTKESDDRYKVVFKEPQRAVAPGQYVVFYNDEECLGGGVILS